MVDIAGARRYTSPMTNNATTTQVRIPRTMVADADLIAPELNLTGPDVIREATRAGLDMLMERAAERRSRRLALAGR